MVFDWVLRQDEVTMSCLREPSEGTTAEWPPWVSEASLIRLAEMGVPAPWRHQAEAAEAIFHGEHTVICTPTASGKSLAYTLPIIAAAEGRAGVPVGSVRSRLTRPQHCCLYVAPTKALAHDQARSLSKLGPRGWAVSTLDGDSADEERRFARDHATFILTNPDMLHHSMLPNHRRWSRFLGSLRYIVIDEAHRYHGVFGAHIAQVIRRLRRVATLHGAHPTFALSLATLPDAAGFASALTGVERVRVVDQDHSPSPRRVIALWRPSRSLRADTATLMARLADAGAQTIAFVSSRQEAELVSLAAREVSVEPSRIAAYRGGYLAADRRELEADLHTGGLRALASTNALESGVDIAGMDAVLISGYPGRLSSFWQQAGRAGRRGRDCLVVLLARENPLDIYLLEHPEALFDQPVERVVLHPDNPRILGPHLAAAAQEHPLTADDDQWFGPTCGETATALAAQGVLRDRGGRYFWPRPDHAAGFINLRSAGAGPIDIIEQATGRLIGIADGATADRTLHPGAVYLHQGESFIVDAVETTRNLALVTTARPRYYTQAQMSLSIEILNRERRTPLGATEAWCGQVRLSSTVTGYLRRDETTHEVWDSTPLTLPTRTLLTQAMWWTVPADLEEQGWEEPRLAASLHAMEHTAIGLLPAFAPCDRWDVGGLSTATHPDTGLATVFVYDATAGGAGFSHRGFEVVEDWLAATLERLTRCPCETGCPACVVSPKCGNANQLLDKPAARDLLQQLLDAGAAAETSA